LEIRELRPEIKTSHTLFFSASPSYSLYLPAQIAAGLRGRLPGKWRIWSWCCVVLWCGAVLVWTRYSLSI